MRPKTDGEGKARLKVRKPLDKTQVRDLMAYLLRSSVVLGEARSLLRPEHFTQEPHFAVLLDVLYERLDANDGRHLDGLLSYMEVYDAVRERVNAGWDALPTDARNWLLWRPPHTPKDCNHGVIYWALMELTQDDLHDHVGLELLKRFLNERVLMQGLDKLVTVAQQGDVLTNYSEFTSALGTVAERIEAISEQPSRGMRPPDGKAHTITVLPTNVTFIDTPLGGGVAAGEAYGLSGPTGGGKSTMVYQAGLSFAKTYPRLLVCHFSYEDDQARMDNRTWSCAAEIDKDVLARMEDPEEARKKGILSSRAGGKFKAYEIARQKKSGVPDGQYRGEYDRLMEVWDSFHNYRMFDMTRPGMGAGHLDEIASLVQRTCRELAGQIDGVGLVVIDSIDLVCANHMDAAKMDPKAKTDVLTDFASQARRKISGRFDAATFLVNQLAGDQLKKAPAVRMSHADAAGSKSWAKSLDFSLNLGNTVDKGEGKHKYPVGQITCSKARRAGTKDWSTTVRLLGRFGYWEDCSAEYTVYMGQIMATRDMQLAGVGAAATPRSSAIGFDELPFATLGF